MAASDRPATSRSSGVSRWLPDSRDDVVLLVAGVTLLALIARFVLLGDRIAHWDEGRVAYWIVHYQETGSFAYRRIIHGPFIQHVNRWLFALVGANDFTMRLPVALVGGLLPLSALLFREHLRRIEMVAMALFLAFNPVLLYYSRFMRSDVLVAAFMFVSFGLLVRLYDTGRARYLFGAAAFAAFGFASKENAAVYVLTWIGATGLLIDQTLYRPRNYANGYALLVDKSRHLYANRLAPWLAAMGLPIDVPDRRATIDGKPEAANGGHVTADDGQTSSASRDELTDADVTAFSPLQYVGYLTIGVFIFLGFLLFFYAPRGAGMEGLMYPPADPSAGAIGFWESLANPSLFPQMVEGTWNHASEEFGTWFGKATEGGDEGLASVFIEYLGRYVEVMLTMALPLTGFAVFGFLVERYGSDTSRNLVMFAGYTGFVSVLGYPLGTDIFGAWLVVHALVPLSIPAAVGLARIFDWGYAAFAHDDGIGVAIAAVFLLLVAGQVAMVAGPSVYTNAQADENNLVQYAQPAGSPDGELQTMAAIARENRSGSDVLLYYGEQGDSYDENSAFVKEDLDNADSARLDLKPLCSNWFNSLPLPWYFAKDDVDVNCSRSQASLTERLQSSNAPPIIITQDRDETVPTNTLELEYTGTSYELRSYGTETTFWVDKDIAN